MRGLDEEGQEIAEVAVHEAGHATVAEQLGVGVERTRVYADGTGVTELDWSSMTLDDLKPGQLGQLMAVFFGGLVAVRAWASFGALEINPRVGAAGDLAKLEEWAREPGAPSLDQAEDQATDVICGSWGEVIDRATELIAAPPSWWAGTRTVRT